MSHIKDTNIRARDSYSLDAAGRFRTSGPEVTFETKLINQDKDPLDWNEDLISGAGISGSTPTATAPYVDIISTTPSPGRFARATFKRFNLQGGKSIQITIGGVLELSGVTVTGCVRSIGAFGDADGMLFQSDAGAIRVIIRRNSTDTVVEQANWNLDTMDGNGPSGITIDFSLLQNFLIDFAWPGRVRYGLVIDGVIFYVHQFVTLNVSTIPLTDTSNCPIRYELEVTIDSGECSMRCTTASVIIDGKFDDLGIVRYISSDNATVNLFTQNVSYAILALRLKTTALGTRIRITNISVLIEDTQNTLEWFLMFNPIVAGPFVFTGLADSAIEFARGTTANVITGGVKVFGGYVASGSNAQGAETFATELRFVQERLGVAIDGTRDEVVLAAKPIAGGSNLDAQGSLTWLEQV